MSSYATLYARFPPRVSPWRGVGIAALTLAAVHGLQLTGHLPAEVLGDARLLHPIALVGHALVLVVGVSLLREAYWVRRLAKELDACDGKSPDNWAAVGMRECLRELQRRCSLKAYEHKLEESQTRWAKVLDRRWTWYYCAALALFVPGMVLVPLGLQLPSEPPPDPGRLFLPLAVGGAETVLVFLAAMWARVQWGDLFHKWMETAVEIQMLKAQVSRASDPARLPAVATQLAPIWADTTPPSSAAGAPEPSPSRSSSARTRIPTTMPQPPQQQATRTSRLQTALPDVGVVGNSNDVEFVFNNEEALEQADL